MTIPIPPSDPQPPSPPFSAWTSSGLWRSDEQGNGQTAVPWLWQGYLAAGNLTLFTSQWKSGKTTLLAVLLSRMKTGGPLAGLTVAPGTAAVISEESPVLWHRRNDRLDFGDHVTWFCRPFLGRPSPGDWLRFIEHLAGLHQRRPLTLVAIDPLAAFLPVGSESDPGAVLDALLSLQRLTAAGVAVLILHHPRKGKVRAGQASRGTGALGGHVDILLEMNWYAHPTDDDRRRCIEAFSRFDETPRRHVIELTPDGTGYVSHGDCFPDEFDEVWGSLTQVLGSAADSLTRQEILARWPAGSRRPADVTLWRWLERAVAEGRVRRSGSGRRNDPYRFGRVEGA